MKLNKKIIIGVPVVIVLSILIFSFQSDRRKNIDLGVFNEVPSLDTTSITSLQNGKYYYSNNRYLVSYDVKTGQTQKITSTLQLPRIDDIKASLDGKYVAFKTVGDVNESADNNYLPTWWVASTSDGSLKKISNDAHDLDWIDNQTAIVAVSSSIAEYSVVDGKTSYIFDSAGVIDRINSVGDKIFFHSGNTVAWVDKQSKEINELYNDVSSVIFESSSECMLLGRNVEDSEFSEYTITNCGHIKSDLIEKYIESPKFSSDGSMIVFVSKTSKGETGLEYIGINNKTSGDLIVKQFENSPNISIISFENQYNALIKVNNVFYASNASIGKKLTETTSTNINGVAIDINPTAQEISASKKSDFSAQDRAAIDNYIKSKGWNPDLLLINYIVVKSDQNRWD